MTNATDIITSIHPVATNTNTLFAELFLIDVHIVFMTAAYTVTIMIDAKSTTEIMIAKDAVDNELLRIMHSDVLR